jgi:DivIVA domain-containing protein
VNRDIGGRAPRFGLGLTPEVVRSQEFTRTTLLHRGYDEAEVREFLHRIAEKMADYEACEASVRAENERLEERLGKLTGFIRDGAYPNGRGGEQLRRPDLAAVTQLSRTQQATDMHLAETKEYCRQLVDEAYQQVQDIMNDAHRQAAEAAAEAAAAYRAQTDVSSEVAELERRRSWLETYLDVTVVQARAQLAAVSAEMEKLTSLPTKVGTPMNRAGAVAGTPRDELGPAEAAPMVQGR